MKVRVPADWADAADDRTVDESLPDVVKNIVVPCSRQRGDDLPVSAFLPYQDGTYPLGTSKYDKRGIAAFLPQWDSAKCLQCNQCTFVCPHAAIRAYLVDEEEAAAAPAAFTTVPAKGAKGLQYRLQVSTLDFTGCGSSKDNGGTASVDVRNAKSIADLAGAKIAAQTGTFHADALEQIPNVQASTYPEFSDLLTALKSGAIDGYVAEEPTAFSVCASNDDLTYLPFKNNDTGFTATAADVGIAIGLKKGNTLRDQINTVLAEITDEQRSELMEQIVTLASGGTVTEFAVHCDAPATTTGTLKIGMECAYEPYNWTDTEGTSLGAVPISSEGQSGLYANGYDVQIAQYVANRLGLKLEIYAMEWDSLIPAVNSGAIDAIVAGMSPTAERSEQLDFTDTYYESNLVVIIRK